MNRCKKGFSLVEMSIVLIIFGLVLASASSILTLFVNKGGAERTRKMIDSNKNTLYSVAASDGNFLDVNDTAKDTHAELLEMLTYPNDAYNIAFHLITAPELNHVSGKQNLTYKPICGSATTTYDVILCGNAACDSGNATVDNVAFAIVSGGANKNVQTDVASNQIRVYPQGADAKDDETGTLDRDEKYDDIVDWVTLPELRAKAGCDPERLTLLTKSLPVMSESVAYDFSVYPSGGVPFVASGDNSVEEYNFALGDDDGLIAQGISFDVINQSGGSSTLTAGGSASRGVRMQISGTPGTLNAAHIIEVILSDDGGNSVTKTLYIQKQ
jgi:prepilin-type N-terminal cleavage/methylation domain-containing protein